MANLLSNVEIIDVSTRNDGSESLFGENLKENGSRGIGHLWNYIAVSSYWKGCFVHEANRTK